MKQPGLYILAQPLRLQAVAEHEGDALVMNFELTPAQAAELGSKLSAVAQAERQRLAEDDVEFLAQFKTSMPAEVVQ